MTVLLRLPGSRQPTTPERARALVFEDAESQALQRRIERLAPSDATILVTGETGTGKEIVARYLHDLSSRAAREFVAVNCGALSESLIESELFGHVRGAFTGATADKAGWFEAAEGGTLFLDEIGDLSPSLQVKLLRVLQEREVVRLGSRQAVPIDVRLIAATNLALEEAVIGGRFRADLYYRLVVARVALAPLRRRPGDILPLARYFVARYAARGGHGEGGRAPELTPQAERELLRRPWPGNIRELENAVHHALLLCRDGLIQPEDLPVSTLPAPLDSVETTPTPAANDPALSLSEPLAALYDRGGPALWKQIEEIVFRTAYEHAGLNQLKTARLLGVTRSIVRARLLEFGALAPSTEAASSAEAPAGPQRAA